ncbi:AAA family ATPase [Chroococcidiopsis sp. FACHB-1243]|nr:AAA family ATPase [Chroococcidiopsis sp. [FACHB-1243]]
MLLVGLPGSGKSTLVGQLVAADPKLQLISTDKIRERLFGNEVIQGEWLLVWREVQRQFQSAAIQISRGEVSTAIYDATNAQRRHRREVIVYARAAGLKQIVGLWVDTPVWLCLARNRRRDRQVPEEVILRMHRQLRDAPPSLSEGLDCLLRFSQLSVCTSTTLPQ